MERARHRRSKSCSSGIEGTQKVQKQQQSSRLSSDSKYRSNWDDRLLFELGRSSGQVTGVPMKKLLAKEMSKEVDSKKGSPSVVARLMGLDVMPPPSHVRKQQKGSPEGQKKCVSVNIKPNIQLHDGRLRRRSSVDKQEFKDVYEDFEASRVVNRQCSSGWPASFILTKPDGALFQQKFVDARRHFADERLPGSQKLNDTSELLDANSDLLLEFLQQSNSLVVKHLHDLQVDSGSSVGDHIAVLKPLSSVKGESKVKSWRTQVDTVKKHHFTSHPKREDGSLLEMHNHYGTHISSHLSRYQRDEKIEKERLPTKVVILKPNFAKTNASCASSDSSHGYQLNRKKSKEFPNIRGAEMLPQTRNDPHGVDFSMPISTKARGIAREVTMRMGNGCDNVDTWSIGFKGYAGDESSYDVTESDSESESEVFGPSSMKSFNDHNLCRYPFSPLGKSSVNKEAKKRLSERWKKTHNYQDLEMISRSSTLGEMLSLPAREFRPQHLNADLSLGRLKERRGNHSGSVRWGSPLGINTMDGWNDKMAKRSSKSRSLPPSRAGRSPTYQYNLMEEEPMVHSGCVHHGRSKDVMGNLCLNEHKLPKYSKSRSKKRHSDQHMFFNETNSSSEANSEIQMEAKTNDIEQQQAVFQMTAEEEMFKSPVSSETLVSEHKSPSLPSKHSEPLLSMVDGDKSPTDNDMEDDIDMEDSTIQDPAKEPPEQHSPSFQCFGTEPDPSNTSNEAEDSSPVSVLEVPFIEDTPSTYESFEQVSAELHELRMQLQLLKMESGDEYIEASTNVPIDKQVAQLASPLASEGNTALSAEGWETSYIVDVLTNSGLQDFDFNSFRTRWHSSESPLDPKVLDILENKYSNNQASEMRSERRLLFDRVNSALLDVDLCPWVMPKSGGVNLQRKEVLGDVFEKLTKQDFGKGEITDEVVLQKWAEFKEEIEVIGNEIEELMIDDILTEIVS